MNSAIAAEQAALGGRLAFLPLAVVLAGLLVGAVLLCYGLWRLLRSPEPAVLLHGDLHHYNILSAQRAPWLAIDPHGLVGEPAFETGAFFGNPFDLLDRPDPARILQRRADILAERLMLGRARIVGWGFAYQMLSAVWSAERGGTGWRRAIGVAEILAAMQ